MSEKVNGNINFKAIGRGISNFGSNIAKSVASGTKKAYQSGKNRMFSGIDPTTGLPYVNREVAGFYDVANQFIGEGNVVVNNITSNSGNPIAVRSHFLNALDQWEFSLPLNQLWMVFFTIPRIVTDHMYDKFGEALTTDLTRGGINRAHEYLNTEQYMRHIGCAFAQTVSIPQEQNAIEKVGPTNRGFLKAPILQQRQQFASLNIEFLETNMSFVDFLIRPWIVLSSHLGYVKRTNAMRVSVDMMLVNFAKGGSNLKYIPYTAARANGATSDELNVVNSRGFVPRKIYMFNGCTPINTASERYGYSSEGSIDRRDTEWTFKRYHVQSPKEFSESMQAYHDEELDMNKKFWDEHHEKARKQQQSVNFNSNVQGAQQNFYQQFSSIEGVQVNPVSELNPLENQAAYIANERNTYVGSRTGTRPGQGLFGGGFDILSFLGL